MSTDVQKYPWTQELEKTIVHSLTTSFGLDFLLFEDKDGGNVDTIHNVRKVDKPIWASSQEENNYKQQVDYKDVKSKYHSSHAYITKGRADKKLQQEGILYDPYSGKKIGTNESRDLDHVISAHEIHNDAGRVLAGLDGIELANQDSNLSSTNASINRSKKHHQTGKYLDEILPKSIENSKKDLKGKKNRLQKMQQNTPEEQHKTRQLEDEIRKAEEKIKKLESIDKEAMAKKDQESRNKYNTQINVAYYTSSKFLKNSATDAGLSGIKMGTRQMLGLIFAEIWFELKAQLPAILENLKNKFNFNDFILRIQETLSGIWTRVKLRFQDFLSKFKEGVFAGIMSSITTTIFNIFATTHKLAIKIIRETWGQISSAFKILFFNPDRLGFVDLCKAVTAIISTGVGIVIGSTVHAKMLPFLNFPFGQEIAAFASALITGIATLGLTYVMLYSEMAQKMWEFVSKLMPHTDSIRKFQAVNQELDRYLLELAKIEFNLDVDELEEFSMALSNCTNEMQKSAVLEKEIQKRGIELPYEMGNSKSTRKWLSSLVK